MGRLLSVLTLGAVLVAGVWGPAAAEPLLSSGSHSGVSGLTINGFVYPSSASAIASTAAATNGQLLIGSTDAAPVLATLTGTADQVTVANGAGTITLSLPSPLIPPGTIQAPSGTTAAPAYTFSADTGVGLYRVAASGLGIVADRISLYSDTNNFSLFYLNVPPAATTQPACVCMAVETGKVSLAVTHQATAKVTRTRGCLPGPRSEKPAEVG